MHLADALRCQELAYETLRVDGGKTQIAQTTLVATPGCVPKDHRKNIDADMVKLRPLKCRSNQETPVTATEIDDQRGLPPEQADQVEWPVNWQFLQGSARPLLGFEDFTWNGNAEFAFDAGWFFHVNFNDLHWNRFTFVVRSR